MTSAFQRTLALTAAAGLLAGCLPGDTRPTPGVVHFTVEPSQAIIDGVTTVDGWHITFEKFLVGFGYTSIAVTSTCANYGDGSYDRLVAFTVPGRQKLIDMYGLGTCSFYLNHQSPTSDAVLGDGVTAADLAFMRSPGAALYLPASAAGSPTGPAGEPAVLADDPTGAAVYVVGRASRGAVTMRFAWASDSFGFTSSLSDCNGGGSSKEPSEFTLHGGDVIPLAVVVRGEELFRESKEPGAPLRFDAFAGADTDGDQTITPEELAKAPAPPDDDHNKGLAGFIFNSLLRVYRLPRASSKVCPNDADGGTP